MRENRPVGDTGLHPPTPLVLAGGKGTTLTDVCCTLEKPHTALQDARWQNMEKHKLDRLLRNYQCVTVWAMSCSDQENDQFVRSIRCRSHLSSSKSFLSATLPPPAITRTAHPHKSISRTYTELQPPGHKKILHNDHMCVAHVVKIVYALCMFHDNKQQ